MFIKSKIQFFESKSQHAVDCILSQYGCLSSQRYNFLKANHNMVTKGYKSKKVVYQVKDTIFWKQITTLKPCTSFLKSCLSSQRYNFLKANHNWFRGYRFRCVVVYQVKDTIFWKQITTQEIIDPKTRRLFIKSKIQFFESKSQPVRWNSWYSFGCLSSQRYNFLKANHNQCLGTSYLNVLFIKSKIQFFESKSQQMCPCASACVGCLSSQRYNFLKANHNRRRN